MKTVRDNQEQDTWGAIGIGAMIVFISLILVAAVASAVIIQTAEKLQQNAQRAGDDTSDELSGKLTIMQGFIEMETTYSMLDWHLVAIQYLPILYHSSYSVMSEVAGYEDAHLHKQTYNFSQ